MFTKKHLLLIVLVSIWMLDGISVDALEASDYTHRQALMDQEMDCINRQFSSGEGVTWERTCASPNFITVVEYSDWSESSDFPEYSSDGYDIGKVDQPARYYDVADKKFDTPIDNTYEYPQVITTSSGIDDDVYDLFNLQYISGENDASDRFFQADLSIMVGHREDHLDWNIASDITGGATPNILSELTWSGLEMVQIKANTDVIIDQRFILDGMVAYADIYHGNNQDSDYNGNDRTLEFSRSNNKSNDGEALDWSAGLGYRMSLGPVFKDFLSTDYNWISFFGGYSYHKLDLNMTDGFQTIPATGSFDGLRSTYSARWDGPWAGIELESGTDKVFGKFRYEYHWADYYGSANWNLRTDFQHPKSFEHIAEGKGAVFNLSTGYNVTNRWTLDLSLDIQDWKTGPGIDRTFFTSGTITEIRLNEVNWESKALMLGSTYNF